MNIITDGEIPQKEIDAYIERAYKKYGKTIKEIHLSVDKDNPEYVNIEYRFEDVPFERIRRITGYLVGTTKRWNSAKLAELHDRVKHG
jgi:hypothetical protein